MLLTSLVDQITIGLGIANQAIGKIRDYSLYINTIKFLTLPVAWLLLYCGYGITSVLYAYISLELVCAMMRIPFLHYTAGLSYKSITQRVLLRIICPTLILVLACTVMQYLPDMPLRFLITGCVCVLVSIPAVWAFGLERIEKDFIITTIRNIRK